MLLLAFFRIEARARARDALSRHIADAGARFTRCRLAYLLAAVCMQWFAKIFKAPTVTYRIHLSANKWLCICRRARARTIAYSLAFAHSEHTRTQVALSITFIITTLLYGGELVVAVFAHANHTA